MGVRCIVRLGMRGMMDVKVLSTKIVRFMLRGKTGKRDNNRKVHVLLTPHLANGRPLEAIAGTLACEARLLSPSNHLP